MPSAKNAEADDQPRHQAREYERLGGENFADLCTRVGQCFGMGLMAAQGRALQLPGMDSALPLFSRHRTQECKGIDVLRQGLEYVCGLH